MCEHRCHCACETHRIGQHIPPFEFQGLNSSHQAWWQAPLSAEPSRQPKGMVFRALPHKVALVQPARQAARPLPILDPCSAASEHPFPVLQYRPCFSLVWASLWLGPNWKSCVLSSPDSPSCVWERLGCHDDGAVAPARRSSRSSLQGCGRPLLPPPCARLHPPPGALPTSPRRRPSPTPPAQNVSPAFRGRLSAPGVIAKCLHWVPRAR